MASDKIKIILDTNILISFLITRDLEKLDNLILSGKIKLIFSDELLDEFITVIQRPKFQRFFSPDDLEMLVNFFLDHGLFIEIVTNLDLCRDKKDNFLLNLAKDGAADYLITGDKDLLELVKVHNTRIVTMPEFLNILD
jgi:putative PIN family toxin of toxin-antitoxin system